MKKSNLVFYRNKAKLHNLFRLVFPVIFVFIFVAFIISALFYGSPISTSIGVSLSLLIAVLVKKKLLNNKKALILGLVLSLLSYFIPDVRSMLILLVFFAVYYLLFIFYHFKVLFRSQLTRKDINEFFVINNDFVLVNAFKIPRITRFDQAEEQIIPIQEIDSIIINEKQLIIYSNSYTFYSLGLKQYEIEKIRLFVEINFPQLITTTHKLKQIKSSYLKKRLRFYTPVLTANFVFIILINKNISFLKPLNADLDLLTIVLIIVAVTFLSSLLSKKIFKD